MQPSMNFQVKHHQAEVKDIEAELHITQQDILRQESEFSALQVQLRRMNAGDPQSVRRTLCILFSRPAF